MVYIFRLSRRDPAGARVVTGGEDHSVRVWDVQTGALLQTLDGHEGLVNCAVFSPNGLLIASGSDDHKILLRNVASGTTVTSRGRPARRSPTKCR